MTRYIEALGHFEAASSVYLNTLKFFYGNQKNVSCLQTFMFFLCAVIVTCKY